VPSKITFDDVGIFVGKVFEIDRLRQRRKAVKFTLFRRSKVNNSPNFTTSLNLFELLETSHTARTNIGPRIGQEYVYEPLYVRLTAENTHSLSRSQNRLLQAS
jgi:hypothetical protein